MDIPEFEDLLGRFGDDLSTWPVAQREPAASLLRFSERARAVLAEAQLLRSALQAAPVKAPAGLLDRILQKARQSDNAPADNKPTKRDDN